VKVFDGPRSRFYPPFMGPLKGHLTPNFIKGGALYGGGFPSKITKILKGSKNPVFGLVSYRGAFIMGDIELVYVWFLGPVFGDFPASFGPFWVWPPKNSIFNTVQNRCGGRNRTCSVPVE